MLVLESTILVLTGSTVFFIVLHICVDKIHNVCMCPSSSALDDDIVCGVVCKEQCMVRQADSSVLSAPLVSPLC